jgi:hypothetical protein
VIWSLPVPVITALLVAKAGRRWMSAFQSGELLFARADSVEDDAHDCEEGYTE